MSANLYQNAIAIAVMVSILAIVAACDGPRPGPASIRNDIGMTFVPAGPDTFWMGENPDADIYAERVLEETQHPVILTRAFAMSATEVTQQQWGSVMLDDPSLFVGDDLPVESISWRQATEFCNRLSEAAGLEPAYSDLGEEIRWHQDADGYRLPTEAEWEYAARAGSTTRFHVGDQLTEHDANFTLAHPYGTRMPGEILSPRQTNPVRSYAPNAWGLHDVHGNVWEWCWDLEAPYPQGTVIDPMGPAEGDQSRIARGGSSVSSLAECRFAQRVCQSRETPYRKLNADDEPGSTSGRDIGLRLARNDPSPNATDESLEHFERRLGIEMMHIPKGAFLMGSPPEEAGRIFSRAWHEVRITERFWVATTEITQGQWRSVMPDDSALLPMSDDAFPMAGPTWFQAIEFCNALSRREGLTPAYEVSPATESHDASVTWDRRANGYRLPTEAEWQLAAGPNVAVPRKSEVSAPIPRESAWLSGNAGGGSRAVGQFPSTGVGIYDARGNVWEFCWDWYGPYPDTSVANPTGPPRGLARVKRGGSWGSETRKVYRGGFDPSVSRNKYLGFRVVRNAG